MILSMLNARFRWFITFLCYSLLWSRAVKNIIGIFGRKLRVLVATIELIEFGAEKGRKRRSAKTTINGAFSAIVEVELEFVEVALWLWNENTNSTKELTFSANAEFAHMGRRSCGDGKSFSWSVLDSFFCVSQLYKGVFTIIFSIYHISLFYILDLLLVFSFRVHVLKMTKFWRRRKLWQNSDDDNPSFVFFFHVFSICWV